MYEHSIQYFDLNVNLSIFPYKSFKFQYTDCLGTLCHIIRQVCLLDKVGSVRFLVIDPQRWSAYSEERYTPLAKDSRNTGVYLRECVMFLEEKVNFVLFAAPSFSTEIEKWLFRRNVHYTCKLDCVVPEKYPYTIPPTEGFFVLPPLIPPTPPPPPHPTQEIPVWLHALLLSIWL